MNLMHGYDWNGCDLSGYYAQEKLDGCRLYWDGQRAWTRQGRPVALPHHIHMPPVALDCELYSGINTLTISSAAIRLGAAYWAAATQIVAFDLPDCAGDYRLRHAALTAACAGYSVRVLPYSIAASTGDVLAALDRVHSRGGEGLMLRRPGAPYRGGRWSTLLKVKTPDPLALAG